MIPPQSYLATTGATSIPYYSNGKPVQIADFGNDKQGRAGLTTPISYITDYQWDALSPIRRMYFAYHTDEKRFLLIPTGPDHDYDILPSEDLNGDATSAWIPSLVVRTYDPTNGIESGGDIWRASQRGW